MQTMKRPKDKIDILRIIFALIYTAPCFKTHENPPTPGAWLLLPGRSLLIHEGVDSNRDMVGGSVGCIEIPDGE